MSKQQLTTVERKNSRKNKMLPKAYSACSAYRIDIHTPRTCLWNFSIDSTNKKWRKHIEMISHAIFIVLSHFFSQIAADFGAENFIEKNLWDEKIKNSMSEWKVNVGKVSFVSTILFVHVNGWKENGFWMLLANAVYFLNWSEIFSEFFVDFLF